MQNVAKMSVGGSAGSGAGASPDPLKDKLPAEVVAKLGLLPEDSAASNEVMRALRQEALESGSLDKIHEQTARYKALLDLAEEMFPTSTASLANFCNLEVVETELGRQVSFTLPQGMSFRKIFDWANEQCQEQFKRNAVCIASLFEDSGVESVATVDTKYTFTILKDSHDKTRDQQTEFLAEKGLKWVDRAILTTAAALFRVKEGYPDSGIGTYSDTGDLFLGKLLRAGLGALRSHAFGLSTNCWSVGLNANRWNDDAAISFVVCAGA